MVKVNHSDKSALRKMLKDEKFICVGAGKRLSTFVDCYIDKDNIGNLYAILDNGKSGECILINDRQIPVYSIEQFQIVCNIKEFIILVTNVKSYEEMVEQLDQHQIFDQKNCFIEPFVTGSFLPQRFRIPQTGIPKIEKKIHYCWFGGKEIPEHLQKNIDTWKVYCPDYEIIRWDESNYDIEKNPFMKKAFEEKQWAFVPDYARLDIIYEYGGFYLDTDVELIRSLDGLRDMDMYLGFDGIDSIGMGIGFGAKKHHRLLSKIMCIYDAMVFDVNKLVSSNIILTQIVKAEGGNIDNTFQYMKDFILLPSEVLAPYGYNGLGCGITANSYSIHHNEGSWIDNMEEVKKEQNQKNTRYFQWINKRKEFFGEK